MYSSKYDSQGQSIKGKVVYDLVKLDKYHGLIYSDFYRTTIFGEFGVLNIITSNRLINIVFQPKIFPGKAEG